MTIKTIERDGKRFVLVPEEAFHRMVDDLDDLADIRAYDRAKARAQEFVPAAIADRLIAGENPIRVWREHRRLTQDRLARAAGISKPYLSQLEHGRRKASVATLKRVARALSVDLDDLT